MSHEGIRFVPADSSQPHEPEALPAVAVTPAKVRVRISDAAGVEIDWRDGHRSAWSFAFLRDACPCATCAEERAASGRAPGQPAAQPKLLLPMFKPAPKPASAERVGNYALRLNWNDGHNSGIFSWDYLRRICRCDKCAQSAKL